MNLYPFLEMSMKMHQVSCSEDGYANWIVIHDADPVTKMKCVEFFTTYERAKDPDDRQRKHSLMVTEEQLAALARFLGVVTHE